MPSPFARPCQHPGCRNYAETGKRFCKEHLKDGYEYDRYRGTRSQRGYTNAWLRLSRAFLKAHPLCAECQRQGRLTAATEVDHIIPHKGNKDLFWNEDNLQALCHECHSRKTGKEDGGFGNAMTPRGSQK